MALRIFMITLALLAGNFTSNELSAQSSRIELAQEAFSKPLAKATQHLKNEFKHAGSRRIQSQVEKGVQRLQHNSAITFAPPVERVASNPVLRSNRWQEQPTPPQPLQDLGRSIQAEIQTVPGQSQPPQPTVVDQEFLNQLPNQNQQNVEIESQQTFPQEFNAPQSPPGEVIQTAGLPSPSYRSYGRYNGAKQNAFSDRDLSGCCDEWDGFCRPRNITYGCNCGNSGDCSGKGCLNGVECCGCGSKGCGSNASSCTNNKHKGGTICGCGKCSGASKPGFLNLFSKKPCGCGSCGTATVGPVPATGGCVSCQAAAGEIGNHSIVTSETPIYNAVPQHAQPTAAVPRTYYTTPAVQTGYRTVGEPISRPGFEPKQN